MSSTLRAYGAHAVSSVGSRRSALARQSPCCGFARLRGKLHSSGVSNTANNEESDCVECLRLVVCLPTAGGAHRGGVLASRPPAASSVQGRRVVLRRRGHGHHPRGVLPGARHPANHAPLCQSIRWSSRVCGHLSPCPEHNVPSDSSTPQWLLSAPQEQDASSGTLFLQSSFS